MEQAVGITPPTTDPPAMDAPELNVRHIVISVEEGEPAAVNIDGFSYNEAADILYRCSDAVSQRIEEPYVVGGRDG